MLNKKRVLLVFRSLNAGGVESFIVNLLENMDLTDLNVDICIFDTRPEEQAFFEERLKLIGVNVIKLWAGKGKLSFYVKQRKLFRRYLSKNQYDVVHIQCCFADDGWACRVAKKKGIKNVIVHAHMSGIKLTASTWRHWMCHYLGKVTQPANRYGDILLACSLEAGEWMYGKKATKGTNFFVVNNGIRVEEYQFDLSKRKAIREKLNLSGKYVIGHIGRFSQEKNQQFLVDILCELEKCSETCHLLLMGDGPLKQSVIDKAREYGLEKKITIVDNSYKASFIYDAMDLFVFPSLNEGFGIVCIEAQTNGLKCIVSDAVPKTTNVSGKVTYLNIQEKELWIKAILEEIGKERCTKSLNIPNFDIRKSARQVYRFYTN